ncbi:DUF3806 domain-containing protein [Halioxenophilus aromaticivorans]|uniref:DUF3806 domain-containing protein n=1 Tax=Halioxenophilus aromaticivorans TaxID=1306992 RepID=A0AAV3UAN0_9ALTE
MIRFIAPILISLLTIQSALAEKEWPQVSDMKWTERRQLDSQREWVEDLSKEKLGQNIRQTSDDLEALQRIIHKGLIKQDQSYQLQSLGVVLGDLFVKELGLEWRIYEDEKGRSRATCAPNTQECLFPITMLSRRMEVGLMPDVNKIYSEASDMIKPHLPALPYEAKPK